MVTLTQVVLRDPKPLRTAHPAAHDGYGGKSDA